MTTLRQAAQQALEALEAALSDDQPYIERCKQTRTALRAALAEQEQEPVVDCPRCGHCCPQRKPLTGEEIAAIVREAAKGSAIKRDGSTSERIARAIEAAHGIGEKK